MGPDAPAPLNAAIELPPPRPKERVTPIVETTPVSSDPPAPTTLVSGDLVVEIDAAAGRFVQTLRDSQTEEILRQWPNEGQLAFARGVRAYLKALKSVL